MVVAAEERLHFFELHRVQIGDLPDGRPVIRMVRRKQPGENRHRGQPVRPVLVVLPPFVEHDVALIRELRLGQRRQQIAHAIRFHPERQLQRVGGHDFPVVRAIRVGRSVERRAGGLQRMKVAAVVMLGPLEHQMLEQVREAGLSRPLVLRADVIPQVHRDDRARAVFVQEDVESVVERVFREGKVQFLKLPQVSISHPYLTTVSGIVGVRL